MSVPQVLAPEPGPETLKERRWGGHRLAAVRGGPELAGQPIGESWEFSTLAGSESRALGRGLAEVLGGPLPFLAKLLDTALPLSIQVHPDDEPSRGITGKEEAWIVLDAEPEARVLAGLADGIDRAHFEAASRAAVADPDRGDALIDCLRPVPAEPGMVILVPARTPHAIGPGILLAEIQQPIDCTYRIFDYGSGRELHTDLALATVVPEAQPRTWRPGEPPTSLEGKHLHLQPLPPGTHALEARQPHLVVTVRGPVRLHAGPLSVELEPHDLRLITRDEYRLEVGDGGLAVAGWIRA